MRHTLIATLFVFSVLACSQSKTSQMLNLAEQDMNDNPENALSILERISQDALSTKEDKARFALLMSMALDKNYIDVQNDSLISIAVDYYSNKEDQDRRMKALYYKGIVQKNANSFPAAIVSLEKAKREACELQDFFYMGLTERNIGEIYNRMANRSAALKCMEQAYSYFLKGGYDVYAAYALLSIAVDYYNMKDFDKVLEVLDSPLLLSNNLNQTESFKLLIGAVSIEKNKNIEEAIQLYNSVSPSYYDIQDYGYLAIAYERVDKRNMADYWINEGYRSAKDVTDTAAINYMYSHIQAKRGLFSSAYSLIDKAMTIQDSFTQTVLEESLNVALKEYYQDELTIEETLRKHERERLFWIIIMVSLLSISIVCILIAKMRKRARDLTEKMARFATMDSMLQDYQKSNAELVGSLFSERLLHLNSLSRQYFQIDEKSQKELVFNSFKKDLEEFHSQGSVYLALEKDLNTYCNEVVTKLKSQVPRIHGENLDIAMLFLSGLPYEAIQLITKRNSVDSLKMLRSRIRNEIKKANAPDAQLFLEMLEMKRQKKRSPNNQTNDC